MENVKKDVKRLEMAVKPKNPEIFRKVQKEILVKEELRKIKIKNAVSPHAYYDKDEDAFRCNFAGTKFGSKDCEDYVYDAVKIVEHLYKIHDIEPDDQKIEGWTDEHEKLWKK